VVAYSFKKQQKINMKLQIFIIFNGLNEMIVNIKVLIINRVYSKHIKMPTIFFSFSKQKTNHDFKREKEEKNPKFSKTHKFLSAMMMSVAVSVAMAIAMSIAMPVAVSTAMTVAVTTLDGLLIASNWAASLSWNVSREGNAVDRSGDFLAENGGHHQSALFSIYKFKLVIKLLKKNNEIV